VLEAVGPALAHLRTEIPIRPELTVCLWDSGGPGASFSPPSPWAWWADHGRDGAEPGLRFNRHGEVVEPRSARLSTAFRLRPPTLRLLDARRNLAFSWIDDIARMPTSERCAPLREILAWWMSAHGHQIVHAAAVGTEQGGALIAGKGGAGKSTLALACLGSPLRYAGDDCCVVSVDGGLPRVSSLYSSAKLKTREDLARFPDLAGAVHNVARGPHERAFVFLHRHRPECLSAGFPVRAVLLPRVTGTVSPRLVPVSSAAALAALVPSTLSLFPGVHGVATRRMAQLVSRVPSYRLEMGSDLRRIPDLVLEVLGRA
jgi:hypothetical protein